MEYIEPSSNAVLRMDDDCFVSFDMRCLSCGLNTLHQKILTEFCHGKKLDEILAMPFNKLADLADLSDEETYLGIYIIWDSLKCLIAKYLGKEGEDDPLRCQIVNIDHCDNIIEIRAFILPPAAD